jgi:hypothetical protein
MGVLADSEMPASPGTGTALLRSTAVTSASRGKAPKTFGADRTCGHASCNTKLSRYNAETLCFVHASAQPAPRARG